MGAILLPDATFNFLQCHAADTSCGRRLQSVDRQHPIRFGYKLHIKRTVFHTQNWSSKERNIVYSKKGDSHEPFKSESGRDKDERSVVEGDQDELEVARKALSEARSRQEASEKERDLLLEDLARSTAEQQEHVATIMHDKDLAIAELEEAKSSFNQKLEEALEEKSNLESKLILAKQNCLELAVQVEKAAEMALQQTTSRVVEDAQRRVSAAETSAAETACHFEEKIRRGTEDTMSSIVERSKTAIEKALAVAERTRGYETQVGTVFSEGGDVVDQISSIQSESIKLQNSLTDLESQLLLKKSEVNRIILELEQAQQLANASDLRAKEAEKALLKFQEINKERSLQQEDGLKVLLEKMKKDIEDKKESASKAFKVELDIIKASAEVAKVAAQSKDDAYIKRCEALLRSLRAAEAASKMWRQRAETAESLLQQENPLIKGGDNDVVYVVNGGRIDLLTDDDSQRWKLLSDGPRREIPDWMARRIRTICPKFPPKRTELSKALTSRFKTLELPKHDEVWSIVQEKPSQGDTLVEHEVEKELVEKEVIEKKRKTLERVLQRKTIQWEKTPEEIKLEPGTGSGREIVFQGFNWESWRRQWYLELAPKASDLSRCGITTVWLPPPTKSVAPQGYMPSDLYDLNSAYGSLEELKHCIEEMHAHDILTLGDVVLNHRCAHKQSPNGVWNIFGGKLAWGPEAIVCDDPNFQGRGNPSSGDIFHAAPNVDHSQEFVRNDIKQWLNWLRNEIGFDGWRLDFVRGFSGGYVKEYIESSNPAYAVGEYWDSLAYEGGNMCYNQDAHRQRIINWINATGGTSSAFDVTTKGILHSALHNQYWRLIDPSGKPTGVMGWWPSRAVTFLENHDTGSTQGHWPFPRDKLNQGYAYILTHPGTPVVFYDHFYDFGIREVIAELIEARRRAGIHCRSAVKIYQANNDGYVAQIGDTLVVKLGHIDWNPSKENQLDGSWQKFVDKEADYQIWLRE